MILSRISVILSSSLAQHQEVWDQPTNQTTNHSCQDPCATLQHSVTPWMALGPIGVALLFCVAGALPVLLCRSRYRVHGVRSCLWVLVALWVQLVLTCVWFSYDRAQAYVWALHGASFTLASWQTKKGVLQHATLHYLTRLAGVWAVGFFAWQLGPPVGLAAWYTSSDALCGWKVHLVGVLGVELVAWVLGPLQGVVVGLG